METVLNERWPAGLIISPIPLRKVISRSSVRANGRLFSRKGAPQKPWESKLEDLFHVVAELDRRVTAFHAQPLKLCLRMNGKVTNRWPDYAVMIDGAAEIHEVKPDHRWSSPKVRAELIAIARFVESHEGYTYHLALESDLRAEPLCSSLATIWRQLMTPYSHVLALRTHAALADAGAPVTARDLVEATRQRPFDPHHHDTSSWERLLSMIADAHLMFDVTKPLTPESLIWDSETGDQMPRLLPSRRIAGLGL